MYRIKTITCRLFSHALAGLKRPYNLRKLADLERLGLPPQVVPALKYLLTGKGDKETLYVVACAERRRKEIADQGDRKVEILYSPKPKASGNDSGVAARPQPGKILEFTMTRVAATGKNHTWGAVLYLLAREFASVAALELGACAGISAMYLSSAPKLKRLTTVEGSAALAEIASNSLRDRSNAKVVNKLFDDAIDSELEGIPGKMIDFAFIDGHHEKVATIHYFNRLLPFLEKGAVVVFDDIYWSRDMQAAWLDISQRPEFSHAINFGVIGVCILSSNDNLQKNCPTYWDLQPILGYQMIGDPKGWKE